MRIAILAMDDPLYMNNFIKKIIDGRSNDKLLFVYVYKGNRLTIGKNKSKIIYIISLLLIMGLKEFIRNSIITVIHNFKKKFSSNFNFIKSPLVVNHAHSRNIPTLEITNPNTKKFLEKLTEFNPDIIINQSQCIIKQELLKVPKIGVLNRHNALLPKNRGRLTPFWVLYKGETETGVSIHFVTEDLDAGDIIVQKKFSIEKNDNFNTIVKRNYELAPVAMLKALEKLEHENYKTIPNEDSLATYNTIPIFKEALKFRLRRIFTL
jgi:methionyl-tRNA formyltransferase